MQRIGGVTHLVVCNTKLRKILKKELLMNFVNGTCTREEARQVLAWLNQEGHEQVLEDMIEGDLAEALKNNIVDDKKESKKIFKQIPLNAPVANKRIVEEETNINPNIDHARLIERTNVKHKRLRINDFMKVAASLIVIATISLMIWVMKDTKQAHSNFTQIVKENTAGRKSIIYLKDGSIVHLNANSKISYMPSFSDTMRAIELQGEAYFEVAKDNFRPFVVQTGNIAVKALGTSFNVKNYDDESQICVTLETGRILVKRNDNSEVDQEHIFLDPGKEVQYSKSDEKFSPVTTANLRESLGWKDGVIYFSHADLTTVINKLELWYGVQFELKNKPEYKWSYTAEFQNQTLQDVLEGMAFSQNFTYQINDKYVEINFSNKPN